MTPTTPVTAATHTRAINMPHPRCVRATERRGKRAVLLTSLAYWYRTGRHPARLEAGASGVPGHGAAASRWAQPCRLDWPGDRSKDRSKNWAPVAQLDRARAF